MAILLSKYINDGEEFALRYIAPGKSGARVLLVMIAGKKPRVIKFGTKEIIDREKENYKKMVLDVMPSNIMPLLMNNSDISFLGNASIAYHWIGDYSNVLSFKDYFSKETSFNTLVTIIDKLIKDLFKWYKPKKGIILPFDQWKWHSTDTTEKIEAKIEEWDKNDDDKNKLLNVLNNPNYWRDKLPKNIECSNGICHGDLNSSNIFVVENGNDFMPKVIDFASVSDKMTPARDWAKVERDIKLRSLRDAFPNDPTRYRKHLEIVDTICNKPDSLDAASGNHDIEKYYNTISFIRKKYCENVKESSDMPYLEYLIYLFYHTLAFVDRDKIEGDGCFSHIVLDSAFRIVDEIDQNISNNNIGMVYTGINGFKTSNVKKIHTDKESFDIDNPIPLIPKKYRDWITERCKNLDLDELINSRDTDSMLTITMPQIFITLYSDPLYETKGAEFESKQKSVNIEDLACENEYLIIRGQAGSGKTTLIRHMAFSIINNQDHKLNGYLPVWVVLNSLQNLENKIEESMAGALMAERLLDVYFKETDNRLDIETVKSYCAAGKVIFLLDGLDEVSRQFREKIVLSFSEFRGENKIVLSGRPHGVDNVVVSKFPNRVVTINNLVGNQIEEFIEKWFRFDLKLNRDGKSAENMINEIRAVEVGNNKFSDLINTPLMITAVCLLYRDNKKLPDHRVELYDKLVNNLVYKRFPKDVRKVMEFLMKMAFEVHVSDAVQVKDQRERRFDQESALQILKKIYSKRKEETVSDYNIFIKEKFNEIEQNSGLLKIENQQYIFWHLSFQEFLTACNIQDENIDYKEIKDIWDNEWYEEVFKLFIGYKSYMRNNKSANDIVEKMLKTKGGKNFRYWTLASQSLLEIHKDNRKDSVLDLAKGRLIETCDSNVDPVIKANAGETLGWLGDSRNLEEFIPVEYGAYYLKSLGKKVDVAPFEISRYPVTNSWYEEFINDDDYTNSEFWSGKEKIKQPEYWNDRKWRCPNSPVVGVSWHEANAFAKWLTTKRAKGTYRLPTEKEWEAASGGKEGRIYPWGESWDKDKCNNWDLSIRKTSPVGIFKDGDTPEIDGKSISDLSGNVWEWCIDLYSETGSCRVLRGGSWFDFGRRCRSACRLFNGPEFRNAFIGFRLVFVP